VPRSPIAPREGMMAVVRNRRALVTGVQPSDADEHGRYHLVDLEYTDGLGAETDRVLWEVEPGTTLVEPSALPQVEDTPPMEVLQFDAMVRAARWSALTPSLPFSGLDEDRPPIASPLYGAIHPEAYQLVPVLKALEMPRVALMLADAVGLGKTIQAGLVLRELMLRRRIRRVLVLCPASLRTQWKEELDEKFSIPFEVVDRPATLRLQKDLGIDANPWRTHERIITSYHYLKQPDVLEQFRTTAQPGEDRSLRWDLLIVDEAHNLAPASFGADSDVSRMLQQLAPWFEHRIFLTATPHNGHTRSFSGLLEALDPVRFTRKSALEPEDRRRVGESVIRRLKSEINASYTSRNEAPRFSERTVTALPALHFGATERQLLLALRDFRRALRKLAKAGSATERTAAAFATEVLQKRLLSGPWAFGQSWLALCDGLAHGDASAEAIARARAAEEDDTDDDKERESRQRHAQKVVGTWLRRWQEPLAAEIAELSRLVAALGVQRVPPGLEPTERERTVAELGPKVVADARLRCLERLIDDRLRTETGWRSDERVIVFSEYLATLDYLRVRLRDRYGDGDWLLCLYGGMNDRERDAVKRAFNDPHGPARVLVATDAAGEGLNLQRAARLLLHWDIPWNPGKMEQRNGRLDRHGQERDVEVFHFDSPDDASMEFLGKVLEKRSRTREDRVVTDELFAEAIVAHFDRDEEEPAPRSVGRLDRAIDSAKVVNRQVVDDLPEGTPMPGAKDQERLEELRRQLDLSPQSLRETLETAMAIQAGRPRLQSDGPGRDRFKPPVPTLWQDLVDHTLRVGGPRGDLLALVFDPAHYVRSHSGRPVYVPEPDSRLLHLGHALYHRVMSTFARYRFPGPGSGTRWTVRSGEVPDGAQALVLLTLEELAMNELREPCHHWVTTLALPIVDGSLAEALPHRPAAGWAAPPRAGDLRVARELWEEVARDVKALVKRLAQERTMALASRLKEAGVEVRDRETKRFVARRRELEKALGDNTIARLQRDADELRSRKQLELYTEFDQALERKLADLEAELGLRRTHYEQVRHRLQDEEERILKRVLPPRYRLRGEARVYPIAVELRLPEGAA
jgi:superfamily II DNA or RNA helicase